MFFARPGVYEPCGIYNYKHVILAIIILAWVAIAVKLTEVSKKEDVKKIIKNLTITVWCLEIIKIIFLFSVGQGKINRVVPLYYCSLLHITLIAQHINILFKYSVSLLIFHLT